PRLQFAEVLFELGRLPEAEQQFNTALETDPQNARALLGLARIASERGDLQESLVRLQQAAASPYLQKAVHIALAQVYERKGDHGAPAAEMQTPQRLAADPPWPDLYRIELERRQVGLGLEMERLVTENRVPEAVATARRAVQEYPESADAW